MAKSDVYQSVGGLAPDAQQRIIDRLEFRGQDPVFVAMRDSYLNRMNLASAKRILDLGCGTGVVTRALAKREDVTAEIVGIDLSETLIDAARGLARDEGLSDQIQFRVGDCHALDDADASFDAVVTHTLISHVSDPSALIGESARVTAPGGPIAIFDGDYASMTFGAGDPDVNAGIVVGILDAVVANPHVMRRLPDLLKQSGLELTDFIPELHAEAGAGVVLRESGRSLCAYGGRGWDNRRRPGARMAGRSTDRLGRRALLRRLQLLHLSGPQAGISKTRRLREAPRSIDCRFLTVIRQFSGMLSQTWPP